MSPTEVRAAVSNGIPVPDLDLPVRDSFNVDIRFDVANLTLRWHSQYPDGPEVVTANLLKLTELAPNPYVTYPCDGLYADAYGGRRVRFIFKNLISKLHEFVAETKSVLRRVFSPSLSRSR